MLRELTLYNIVISVYFCIGKCLVDAVLWHYSWQQRHAGRSSKEERNFRGNHLAEDGRLHDIVGKFSSDLCCISYIKSRVACILRIEI